MQKNASVKNNYNNNKKKFLGRKRLNAQYTDKGYDNHSEIIK